MVGHRFALRWVTLEEAERILWPSLAMWIDPVRVSLRHAA